MLIDNVSLTHHLALLRGGRASRHSSMALTGFLLEGRGDHIALVSSNMFSETSCLIDAKDAGTTPVTLPIEFAEIVEKCANLPISLKIGPKRAELVIGNTKARLPVQPGDVFPRLVMGECRHTLKIASKGLKKALEETIPFAPNGHRLPSLNGVLLILQRDRIVCVATNGHVMSVSSAGANLDIADPIQRILPVLSLRQLLKVLDVSEEILITVSDNVIEFKCGQAEFKVKPIQERFPDWKRLMASLPSETVEIDKTALMAAISRSAVFADAKTPSAIFEFTRNGLQISSVAKTNDAGESADIVPFSSGGEIASKRFGANLVYMNAAVSAMGSHGIRMSYALQDGTALWFRKNNNADDSLVIVTPMTI